MNGVRAVVRGAGSLLLRLWIPAAILVAWSVSATVSKSPFFPSPLVIAQAFQENWLFARVMSDVVPSLGIVLGGYAIAVVVGVASGTVLGLLPRLEWVVDPVAVFMRALPALALIPLVFVIGGIGLGPKLFLVALGAVWPILLNTVDGVRSIEPEVRRMAAVYRVPGWLRLGRIVLMGALPQIMAGARISLGVALVLMVGSEMYASASGIGFFVVQAQQSFAMADMWSGIVLLGILGYVLCALFEVFERRVVHWAR